ncbi:MAG: Sapep family Mn(2+)-dependent dipeptidase [Eubacteriales bacterium]|nr:Sapep family Mn(2+)-dependent dipeptidase [Eubacteriales bacterium]
MKTQEAIGQPLIAYRQAMIEVIVDLCKIPSVKGPAELGAPFGIENEKVLHTFLAIGEKLGFKAVNLDGYCGYLEWGNQGPIVAILGHLDVVPAIDGWTHDPFEPVVTDDRIIARGTADDKGPVVAALFAMKVLHEEGFAPNCRIRLIVGLDEESGSECMAHYVKVAELPAVGFTPDAEFPVIFAEKGIAHLELVYQLDWAEHAAANTKRLAKSGTPGNTGTPWSHTRHLVKAKAGQRANMVPAKCELFWQTADGHLTSEVFAGHAAHASMPWEGVNAISAAMLDAANDLTPHPFAVFYEQFITSTWTGEALGINGADHSGPLTLNPGILELNENVARLTLDIRYPATWTIDQISAAMRHKLADEPVEIIVKSHHVPLQNDIDSPLVQKLMRVYNEQTQSDLQAIAIGGGTYARTMPNIVAFGPTFPGDPDVCHQVDEYITMNKLLASAVIYREALRELAHSIQ